MPSNKKEGTYFTSFTNKYTFLALGFTRFSFVSLNITALSSSSVCEHASNFRKISWGWACLEKEAAAKLSMQYFEKNLQK